MTIYYRNISIYNTTQKCKKDLLRFIFEEMFECPNGTIKCPGSYCISRRFLCDGQFQCPGKEDEEDCGKLFMVYFEYILIIL
jgi:hypothetical protein